jgi:hypothetical protein
MVNFGALSALGRTVMADTTDRRTTWAIIIVVLLVLFLLLSRCTGSNGSSKVGAVPNSAGPAEPAPGPTGPVVAGGDTSDDDASDDDSADDVDQGAQDAAGGTVTVDGEPLRSRDLDQLTGKRAVATGARVLTVPADEGFWLSTGGSDRVWVQLTGRPPESPYTVLPGDWVSFTGRITPNGAGFARRVGVTRAEGATALAADREHVSVDKRELSLSRP